MINRITICLLLVVSTTFAQVDFKQQFVSAKAFYKEGKYNLAMEVFKGLIPYDQNNPFSEYASFYYALSAYHQGYKSVAKDMLSQIKNLYPKWDQMKEVNYWIAIIHFENKDYFQAMRMLKESNVSSRETEILRRKHLVAVTDLETLKMMHEEYKDDEVVGELLAHQLSTYLLSPEDQELLKQLIDQFRLKKKDLLATDRKAVFKEVYTVSAIFPMLAASLDPSPTKKRNQFVLDMYEGMKLAVDTLAKQDVKISLRAYDTERKTEKLKSVLAMEELTHSDLLVGPLFTEENTLVQEFSVKHGIPLFNPVSNNIELIQSNPNAYLFQPCNETLGLKSAQFLSTYVKNKKCMVFMGEQKRDEVVANNFLKKAEETDLEIIRIEQVIRANADKIISILATPTEFDEFKYPTQFTLPKDSVGCIFVASDDPLIFSKVLSSVETRGDSVIVLGSEDWMDEDITAVDFNKLENLGTVMFHPNYASLLNPDLKAFVNKFRHVHGRVPSSSAKLGYRFMMFAGMAMKKYGAYFLDGLKKEVWTDPPLSEGFDYTTSRDNQIVPFTAFREGELVVVDKK
ncbi:MAG: hypothetical protein L0Y35_08020 [Flammeovirgaceae bacterium]|nr:hypothetical protein [Flammeovirgaceae bacterium]